jgi:hypothetical protein
MPRRASKKKASPQTVTAFMEAVYPGCLELALSSFDEETCLRDATTLIQSLRQQAAEPDAPADGDPDCAANNGRNCWPEVYGCSGVDHCPNGHRR